MKPKILSQITEEQAQKFVEQDIARFLSFGLDLKSLLLFNDTRNLYHRSSHTNLYSLIGNMNTDNKIRSTEDYYLI